MVPESNTNSPPKSIYHTPAARRTCSTSIRIYRDQKEFLELHHPGGFSDFLRIVLDEHIEKLKREFKST